MTILHDIKAFCDSTGMAPSAFGTLAHGHARLVKDLGAGMQPMEKTVTKLRRFMDEYTPGAYALPKRRQVCKLSAGHVEKTIHAPHERVSRDPCFNCGVRVDIHAEHGCKRFTGGL